MLSTLDEEVIICDGSCFLHGIYLWCSSVLLLLLLPSVRVYRLRDTDGLWVRKMSEDVEIKDLGKCDVMLCCVIFSCWLSHLTLKGKSPSLQLALFGWRAWIEELSTLLRLDCTFIRGWVWFLLEVCFLLCFIGMSCLLTQFYLSSENGFLIPSQQCCYSTWKAAILVMTAAGGKDYTTLNSMGSLCSATLLWRNVWLL